MMHIVFDGMKLTEPIISELTLRTGIPINILYADINLLGGKRYGQMTIERPKDEADARRLIEALRQEGVTVQEVSA